MNIYDHDWWLKNKKWDKKNRNIDIEIYLVMILIYFDYDLLLEVLGKVKLYMNEKKKLFITLIKMIKFIYEIY